MRRREFIGAAATAVLLPLAAMAQQDGRMRRIGVLLGTTDEPVGQGRVRAFRQGLQELKWIEGVNIRIDLRWGAGDAALIKAQAAEIVGLAPDVILGINTPVLRALKEATQTIPVVFAGLADPVGEGIVAGLASPGGNITGFTSFEAPIAGKWLQLLKELSPGIKRIAAIYNPATAPHALFWPALESAAPMAGVTLIRATVSDVAAIESAIAAIGSEPGGGLLIVPDTFTARHRALILALVARHRVPTIYPVRDWISDGGLIAYSSDFNDQSRRAASYVDRILRGAKPSDLPVQQPVAYQLMLNLKTAAALGIEVPSLLLARADEVIE